MSDNKDVQNAEEQRSYCEEYVSQANEYLDYVRYLDPNLADNLSGIVDQAADVVDQAANVEVAGTTVGELVTGPVGGFVSDVASGEDITEAAIDNFAGDAIDEFLEKYANYEDTLLDISYSQTIPVYPPFNARVGASAKAEASLSSERDTATVTCTGNVSANASVTCGISAGFSVAGYGLDVYADIQGGPTFTSSVSISLGASGATLTGTVSPLKIDLTFDVNLIIGVNGIPSELIEWVAGQLGKSTSGNGVVFPLGSIDLLVVRTPAYSASFNIAKGKFTCSSNGEYKAELHPKLKAAIQSAYNTLTNIGQAIADGIVEAAGALYDGAVELAEDAGEAIQEGAEAVGRAVEESAEWVAERAEETREAIEEVVDRAAEVVEDFSEAAQEAYTEVSETISEAYDDAREFVGGVADNISDAASEAADYINRAGHEAIDYAADAAQEAVDYAAEAASSMIDSAADAVSEAWDYWTSW